MRRCNVREVGNLPDMVFDRMIGMVQQVSLQMTHAFAGIFTGYYFQAIVGVFTCPLCQSIFPEAKLLIGIPSAMAHPMAAIRSQSIEAICKRFMGAFFPFEQRSFQFFAQTFVCIQGNNPLPFGLIRRPIFLLNVPFKCVIQHPSTHRLALHDRIIRGTRIHHHNFIRNGLQRPQTPLDILRFVVSDDDGGQKRLIHTVCFTANSLQVTAHKHEVSNDSLLAH